LGAHHRECRAGDVDRAEQGGLDLGPELLRAQLLEEAGVEVARVVDQRVDPAEPVDRSPHGRSRVGGIGDVQLDRQEVVMFPDGRADLLGVPSRGDDCVTSGQRRLGNVDAQATAGAGDQPSLLVAHAVARPSAGICSIFSIDLPHAGDRLVSVYTTQLQAQETIQPAPTSGPHLAHLSKAATGSAPGNWPHTRH
jgi:hypothetical protein